MDFNTIAIYTIKSFIDLESNSSVFDIWREYSGFANYFRLNPQYSGLLEKSEAQLVMYQAQGIHAINFWETAFPKPLRVINNPPSMIYYRGISLDNWDYLKSLSIVGTRSASTSGKRLTRYIIESVAEYKPTIVSGLAYGIDLEAHKKSLDLGLNTIAILGSGILQYNYSGEQARVFSQLQTQSLIISEFEPNQKASYWTFANRNRIIAALSPATIVVEAGENSGALITARFAEQMQRQIWACTAALGDKKNSGNLRLLSKKQAQGLYDIKSIAKTLNWKRSQEKDNESNSSISSIEKLILEQLKIQTLSFDEIQKTLSYPNTDLIMALTNLEINNQIKRSAGQYLRL